MMWDPVGLDALLDRAIEYATLKDVERTGWVLRGVDSPESVADHSWGTAQLCLMFAPHVAADPGFATLDPYRTVSMALVHDLAEVRVGDIPQRMDDADRAARAAEKAALEHQAMIGLTTMDDPDGSSGASLMMIRDLWSEYEAARTPAARFVRDMNLVDMCLEAFIYERDQRYQPESGAVHFPDYARMDEFFETSRSRLSSQLGRQLHAMIEERYRALSATEA